MKTNDNSQINNNAEKKSLAERYCGRSVKEIQQYSNEKVAIEVDDFVREVVDAVSYIVDLQDASSRYRKHVDYEVLEISDTDSTAGNSGKKGVHANVRVRRYRKVTAKQLAGQEKRMMERRRIAAENMKSHKVFIEKTRKMEEARREREMRKREKLEAKEKKRTEDMLRKEQRRKEENEKKERRRMEEEIRKQKREKEEEERKKKRAEEEERRGKRRREEETIQLKKKRESDRFLSFFDKERKKAGESETAAQASVLNVLPFFCKQGVSLAPLFRRKPLSKEAYDRFLVEEESVDRLYLSTVKPRKVVKVRPNRVKLFQFHDNWRPPYYGTWRKRSIAITGRRPFAKDKEMLDYDVDSDEEWEIPEGDDCDESIKSDDDEEDSDHSSSSDSFIVQHGYLSEGEGEDEQDRLESRENPEKRAERLKAVANEWKQNLEKKSKMFAKPLVPLLWGPHFELPAKGVPEEVEEAVFFEYSDDSDDVEVDYDDDYSKHDSSGSCHDDIYIDD